MTQEMKGTLYSCKRSDSVLQVTEVQGCPQPTSRVTPSLLQLLTTISKFILKTDDSRQQTARRLQFSADPEAAGSIALPYGPEQFSANLHNRLPIQAETSTVKKCKDCCFINNDTSELHLASHVIRSDALPQVRLLPSVREQLRILLVQWSSSR